MTDKDYTHIAIVADRSGSMQGIHTDMNGAITRLLQEQAKEPGYRLVDITTFDDKVEHPYTNVRPDDVKGEIIQPRGSTALNDALGYTIVELGVRFEAMAEEDRPSTVIIVVVTDGMENSSKEYTLAQVKALIEHQTENYGWTFMYLAANVDVETTSRAYGFDPNMAAGYVATASGVAHTSNALHSNMSRVANGVRTGWTDEEREAMQE